MVNPLYLDIETTQKIPEDWNKSPTCIPIACMAYKIGKLTHVVHNKDNIGEAMTNQQVVQIIEDLIKYTKLHTLVTFNGSGFDVRLLAEYAKVKNGGPRGLYEEVREMNLNRHIDLMFLAVCVRGHPVSLQKTCDAMGVGSKSLAGGGLEAVVLWNLGGESITRVLEYNKQDVELLSLLYQKIGETSPAKMGFVSKAGNRIFFDVKLLTVNDAYHTEEYKEPLVPRGQFIW